MTVNSSHLENGLVVVSHAMEHLETVAAGLWIKAGSRHEEEYAHGLFHMLEHMAFKGTHQRSARDIVEAIESAGGAINAATGHETTVYHAHILKNDLPLALDILADILQNSVFDPGELARERDVVLQELGQTRDTPDDLVFDHLMAVAFPGQPLGRSILGVEESLHRFDPPMLKQHIAAYYKAPTMVLSVAGGIEHETVVTLARRLFAGLADDLPPKPPGAHFRGGEQRVIKPLEQTHVALAWEGVPSRHPDYYTAQVFSNALGGGMSSRLFQELREKRGLCYSVSSFSWSFADTGLAGFYAAGKPEDMAALLAAAGGEVQRMMDSVSDEEVRRAAAQLKAGLLMGMESPMGRAGQMAGQQIVFGKLVDTSALVRSIDAVDAVSVRRFARQIFSGAMAFSAIGPAVGPEAGGLEPYDTIAAGFAPGQM